ncbi:uncharacterized protein LOC133829332 isoform X2 [Humulus lupulus]|uniref:uncharacterized protein LOC133829332 isoform X2 n=1 Tax=Humulus lupulus TaxID=3486 RepID=UPI002B416D2E|nr:uncharacterized protein LOC133829332 isoform X2 [Humulus lupulus]
MAATPPRSLPPFQSSPTFDGHRHTTSLCLLLISLTHELVLYCPRKKEKTLHATHLMSVMQENDYGGGRILGSLACVLRMNGFNGLRVDRGRRYLFYVF